MKKKWSLQLKGTGVIGMQHSGSVSQWKSYYGTANDAPNGLFYQN